MNYNDAKEMEGKVADTTVLFPGSFDPFTIGHADLVERALHLFGTVVVAVGYNEHKEGWIPIEERVRALKEFYKDEPRIRIISYTGLTAEIAHALGITCILRGVRSTTDYEYELNIADVNHHLTGTETVILLAKPQLSRLSSSVVRELAHYGRDITEWLPKGLIYNK